MIGPLFGQCILGSLDFERLYKNGNIIFSISLNLAVVSASCISFVTVSFSATICIISLIADLISETSDLIFASSKFEFSITLGSILGCVSSAGLDDTGVKPKSTSVSNSLIKSGISAIVFLLISCG